MSLTSREEHIKSMFFPKLMEERKAMELVKQISSIGDKFGFVGNQGNDERRKHKYDVWIANEIKKEKLMVPKPKDSLIDRESEIFAILDWAIETKPNLTALSFDQALVQQARWVERLNHQGVVRPPPINLERIIYKCSNQYFLYLLSPNDLAYEANIMGHCVNGEHYKSKIRNHRSLIISLRDEKNRPHVTIEVALSKEIGGKWKGTVIQQQGKGNTGPNEKYHAALREFALFSNDALTKSSADFLTDNI